MALKRFICTSTLELTQYDDEGFATDETFLVHEGSVFNCDENNSYRMLGGEIRLENDDCYIEISRDTFKDYFEEVRDV